MVRGLKIDAGYEPVPSPQWVKDRTEVGECRGFSSSVDKWDIDRQRDVGGGVKLLVDMKKTGNRSL
jgi:hypothetical protein